MDNSINRLREFLQNRGVEVPKTKYTKTPKLSDEEWIEKYVYPIEHRYKLRTKRLYEHIIPLLDVIEELGQAIYIKIWQGTTEKPYEWYARGSYEIEEWNKYSETEKNELCTHQIRLKSVHFSNDNDEIQAYERKQDVYAKLVMWLNQGKLEAFTLSDNGEKLPMPSYEWIKHQDYYGNYAKNVFSCGRISGKAKHLMYGFDMDGDKHDPEIIYLCNEQFQNLLNTVKPNISKKAEPISMATLRKEYKKYVSDCQNKNIRPTWKDDLKAMTIALSKKPTQNQIKDIRSKFAPTAWKARGRPKNKTD